MNLYPLFKSIAFKLDAEQAHHLSLRLLSARPELATLFPKMKTLKKYQYSRNNLNWSFPVGLAAGFDKNAQALKFFESVGFGAVEIGTVTKKAQIGNPKPRVFRYPKDHAIRNAMGFPNDGMEVIFDRLKNFKAQKSSIGVNIGKNKETSIEDTPKEYALLYEKFAPIADYLVINISSPNTPGLRAFQNKDQLLPLLTSVIEKQKAFYKPLFLKISPDMETEDIKMICELSKQIGLSGIVATNTSSDHSLGPGGLSGAPISKLTEAVRQTVCEVLKEDPTQTIIGAGGVSSYQDLKTFWKQGGHFMQIYTSFIYQGPQLLLDIKNQIDNDLKKHQFNNLEELITNSEIL